MCKARAEGGRRCHGHSTKYDKEAVAFDGFFLAENNTSNSLRLVTELRALKEEQAELKKSKPELYAEHVREHGDQQALSKKLINAWKRVENNKNKMARTHESMGVKNRARVNPRFDSHGFHRGSGLHWSTAELYDSDGVNINGLDRDGNQVRERDGQRTYSESELAALTKMAVDTDDPADVDTILDSGHTHALTFLGRNKNFTPTLDGRIEERILKATWNVEGSTVLKRIDPEDTRTVDYILSQDGGEEALIRNNPDCFSTDYLSNRTIEGYDRAAGVLVRRWREGKRDPLDYARRDDSSLSHSWIAKYMRKEAELVVRMEYAKNKNANLETLTEMAEFDRSKNVKRAARRTLVEVLGDDDAPPIAYLDAY